MEMLSSLRGEKHEFCLVVIKFKHVRSCPSFDITYTSISNNDKICIMGDYNYPSIKWNGILTHDRDFEFVEAIRDAYLCQMVTKPKRS